MASVALSKRSIVLFVACLGLAACTTPDPKGTLDEFETRRAANAQDRLDNIPDAGDDGPVACTAPADLNGVFMLAVDTSVAPGSPMFFEATVTYDADATPPTISMSMLPLTAGAFVPPGFEIIDSEPLLVGPSEVSEDGTFTMDFGETDVVGDANPITGRDIKATLVVAGQIRSADVVCGAVSGDLIAPFEAPLTGSTMGMIRVTDGDYANAAAVLKCPACGDGAGMEDGAGGTAEEMADGEG